MGEYPVEIATSSQILATSDYVANSDYAANVRKQCATFFALYRIIVTCYTGTFLSGEGILYLLNKSFFVLV